MEQLSLTPSTIILLAIIAICVFLAIYRLVKRGMCDCNDSCDSCCDSYSKRSAKGYDQTCSGCKAAESMLKQLEIL